MLFSHLVDLKDSAPGALKQSYEQLFKDVRQCVDLCHRDGVIKDRVAEVSVKLTIHTPISRQIVIWSPYGLMTSVFLLV